jgi:hypothetical protein
MEPADFIFDPASLIVHLKDADDYRRNTIFAEFDK